MKLFKRLKTEARQRVKKKMDAKLAKAEGYSQGSEDVSNELMRQIKALNARISQLNTENLDMEEDLRQHYGERTNLLESRYTDKCKKCMITTEAERERLRKNQNMILDLIQKFNVVFMKVFKHTSLVVDEHDNIIKSSGRVKTSRDILMGIKAEADKIIQKVLPLTSIARTEDVFQPEVEIQQLSQTLPNTNFNKSKNKPTKQH